MQIMMRKMISVLLMAVMILMLVSCGGTNPGTEEKTSSEPEQQEVSSSSETASTPEPENAKSILVVYFSCTGNTKPIAERVAEMLGADLFEIVAEDPYTEEDLKYYTGGRCDEENADPDARPGIASHVENIDQYDTVIIAHPIWFGKAPKIIYTFLESYDFSGKTLTTFCTSHSSPLGSSAENLYPLVPNDVTWLESRRFAAGAPDEEIAGWLTSIGFDIVAQS